MFNPRLRFNTPSWAQPQPQTQMPQQNLMNSMPPAQGFQSYGPGMSSQSVAQQIPGALPGAYGSNMNGAQTPGQGMGLTPAPAPQSQMNQASAMQQAAQASGGLPYVDQGQFRQPAQQPIGMNNFSLTRGFRGWGR